MLRQLIQLISAHRDILARDKRRAGRTFRGRFEQLESRAMLSATIGQTPPPVNPPSVVSTEPIGLLGSPELVAIPVVAPAFGNSDSIAMPRGDGEAYEVQQLGTGPQKIVDVDPPPPPMGIAVQASTKPGEAYVQAWKVFEPVDSAPVLAEFKGSVRIDALPQLISNIEFAFDPEMDYVWHWQAVKNDNMRVQRLRVDHSLTTGQNQLGFESGGGGSETGWTVTTLDAHSQPHELANQFYDGYAIELSMANSASVGQGASATSISQRAYDNVFQSYTTQSIRLTLDSTSSNGIVALSSVDTRLSSDDGQGGFAVLDDSNPSEGAAASADDAIDVVLASLYGVDSLAGDSGIGLANRGAIDATTDGGTNATDGSIACSSEGTADQGGMVLIRSADRGRESIAAAPVDDGPINWAVPDANMHLDASVGIYQAFDVASGELSLSNGGIPAAAAVPVKKHAREAKSSVSADKATKPAMDQAAAWLEMVTAAGVVGASKKRRKTRLPTT